MTTSSDLTILVATHKQYRMPSDSCYLPVYVGSAGKQNIPGFQRDDVGQNISHKNPYYCELTAMYWGWFNLQSNYVGLSHYRRYLSSARRGQKWNRIATGDYIRQVLNEAPIILPCARNYYIETNYEQYVHAHHKIDLDLTDAIIKEMHPDYHESYRRSMARRTGHRFNMFVMRKDLFEEYSEWLFSVLFELESRLDISGYSDYDKRVFGFVAERLLDPWLMTTAHNYIELPVIHLENQRWLQKGYGFIQRKFKGSGKHE